MPRAAMETLPILNEVEPRGAVELVRRESLLQSMKF